MSFIFGGNTGVTYDDLQKRRQIAQSLMGRKEAPKYALTGLGQAAESIAGALMDRKLAGQEKEMRDGFNADFASALGGGSFGSAGGLPAAEGMQGYREAIASIESAGSGDYKAVGPTHSKLGRALGRYQIMESNIGPWSREALGREVSADEFLANPALQDAIFDHKFGGYVQKFGPEGAAQAWFAGPGGVGKMGRKDSLGTSVADYTRKFSNALGGSGGVAKVASQANMGQLASLADNPMASESQKAIVSAILQREMQASDPMRQLQMENLQSQIDARNNPQAKPLDTQYVDGVGLINKQTGEVINDFGGQKTQERDMKKGADDRWRYTDGDKELVFPNIDAAGGKDMTESERRIFMFNSMQKETGPAINLIEEEGFNPANAKDRFANGVLGGNWVKSTEGQMYDAAAGAWAESALRLATGAAATPEEYTRIRGMYFAQVGDSLETIEFKRAMRESYQGVLSRTLSGDMEAPPNPLLFAINNYYGKDEAVTEEIDKAAPEETASATPEKPDFLSQSDADLWEYFTPEEREVILKSYGGR